jgi:hypothetical protein
MQQKNHNMTGDKRIVEGFGGFLNTAKQFIAGVGKGALDDTFLGSKDKPQEDIPGAIYSAEVLRNAIVTTANKIDNILEVVDKADLANAKSSASEITAFLRESFVELDKIIEEGGSGQMTASARNSALSKISSKLDVMTRAGGLIDKWKNEFLGKNNEKFVGSAYLDKGRGLMQEARAMMRKVQDVKAMYAKVKAGEADEIIKRSLAAMKGGSAGDTRPEKPKEIETFGSDAKDQTPEIVKQYRARLEKIGLPSTDTDLYGKMDQQQTKRAMQYIGTITGKVYGDSDEALRDFQKDLGIYVDNKDKAEAILRLR